MFSTPEAADWLDSTLHAISRCIEVGGISVIVLGGLVATAGFLRNFGRQGLDEGFRNYRNNLGRAILLGLEFLVAADIIGTVAVEPSYRNLGILAGIVAIRTFLSISLEVEIEGRWPWQSHEVASRRSER